MDIRGQPTASPQNRCDPVMFHCHGMWRRLATRHRPRRGRSDAKNGAGTQQWGFSAQSSCGLWTCSQRQGTIFQRPGGRAMTHLVRLLQGQSFDPEMIEVMGKAYEKAKR